MTFDAYTGWLLLAAYLSILAELMLFAVPSEVRTRPTRRTSGVSQMPLDRDELRKRMGGVDATSRDAMWDLQEEEEAVAFSP